MSRSTHMNGRLAWRVRNDGAAGVPILFLHGAGGRKEIWSPLTRVLSPQLPDRPLVTIDLPGHGEAACDGCACIADYATPVQDFVEAQGWPQVDLVGHSMGGAVAQRLALDRPERVRRLALLATGAKIPVTPVLFDLLVPGSEEAVIEMFKGFAFGPNTPALLMDQVVAPLHEMNLAVLRDDFIACREWQANERVAAITAPTLVVAGDLDQLTPVKRGRFLAETIPGARLEILPETGHMLPVERIREVAALLASHFGE